MDNLPNDSINKIIESAKNFLSSILKPAAQEFGLLLEDQVRSWRVKNQINILLKAQKHIEAKGMNIQTIPLKILVPLLEQSSLEEDEDLQDLWATMLMNMLDADQNYQNHVFPYILSQISMEDFDELTQLNIEEEKLHTTYKRMRELHAEESEEVQYGSSIYRSHRNKSAEFLTLEKLYDKSSQEGFHISSPESDNLKRLGLIRELPPKILIDEFSTTSREYEHEEWHQIEAKYDPDDYGFRITDLGEMFIKVCKKND